MLELLIVVALIVLNAFFAMSEMALMTSRKLRLKQMAETSRGARKALALATKELLKRIAQNRSVIVIEHDMDFVKQIAHKVTVMHQGKILAEGPMEKVQADPKVIDVYLGH